MWHPVADRMPHLGARYAADADGLVARFKADAELIFMLLCHHPVVEMTLRFEIFPDDLDATVDFYMRVLRFRLTADRRDQREQYVSLQRGGVRVGALKSAVPDVRAARLPPAGVEVVLEVDDVVAERDRVTAAGWPLAEDLQERPWGLKDFRILDPAGYYVRITDRTR